ncbi:MAG: hypothetical protein ACOCZK_07575 [Planctomycetota bacterium]
MATNKVLLVAGPGALIPDATGRDLIAGCGVIAAAAAAAITTTQLWGRLGTGFAGHPLAVLERRGIDTAGVVCNGATPTTLAPGDSCLPAIEPTAPRELGAVLLAGIPVEETDRALAVAARLRAQSGCLVCGWTEANDSAHQHRLADTCDLVMIPAAACTDGDEPVVAIERLRAAGAAAVLLTAGSAGGLMAYKQKRATWGAMPAPLPPRCLRGPVFAGIVAAILGANGRLDQRSLKRAMLTGGAMAGSLNCFAPKTIFGWSEHDYHAGFTRLRRVLRP